MLTAIIAVTLTVPDLDAAQRAYLQVLGYRIVEAGVVSPELAAGWNAPRTAGRRQVLLQPESGERTFLRLVESPPVAGFAAMKTHGWNSNEILVEDPDALLFRARVPIFLAQGGKDFEVDPTKDVAALLGSARKHKRSVEVAEYPSLDHLFKPEGGMSNQASYLEPRAVDSAFLADLAAWVKKTTSP